MCPLIWLSPKTILLRVYSVKKCAGAYDKGADRWEVRAAQTGADAPANPEKPRATLFYYEDNPYQLPEMHAAIRIVIDDELPDDQREAEIAHRQALGHYRRSTKITDEEHRYREEAMPDAETAQIGGDAEHARLQSEAEATPHDPLYQPGG